MRTSLAAAIIVLLLPTAVWAVALARFDFNTPDNNAATGTLVSTTGMGSIGTVGGATTFFGFGTGSSDPELGADNSAWGVGSFPAQGTSSGTVGIEGAVSTAGYNSIRLQFDQKNQPSSNKFYEVQVRTAPAGPFASVATYGIAAADIWENAKSFDLTAAIPAAGNNPDFAFRVVAVFQPGTTQYVASEAGFNGNIPTLFDVVRVDGFVIPEPSSLVIAILAVAMLKLRFRRGLRHP